MALETWGPNATPGDLNVNWPEGRDDLKFGDDHIRLLKTALKNFYTATNALNKTTANALQSLDEKFTGDDAKNSLLLGGKDLAFVLAAANIVGKIGEKNLEFGTTTRKGIVQLSSAVDSASELVGANSRAVKDAYDKANGAQADANKALQGGKKMQGKSVFSGRQNSVTNIWGEGIFFIESYGGTATLVLMAGSLSVISGSIGKISYSGGAFHSDRILRMHFLAIVAE